VIDEFQRRYPSWPHEVWIYGDAMGNSQGHERRGGRSTYTVIMERMQAYRTRMKVPEQNPSVSARVDAVNMALRDSFGASHVVIHTTCRAMATDFERTLADPRGGIKKTYNRADPYSRITHLTDGAGYLITKEAPVKPQRSNQAPKAAPAPGYGAKVRQVGYGGGR
jgi:hypothetical protein